MAGLLLWVATAAAQQGGDENFSDLDKQAQQITQQVIELNKELLVLQEELVFPDNSQIAVFLSMDVGVLFQLESVNVKIDGKTVANHLYDRREVDALYRGGVQRLFLGNLKVGKHDLTATYTGIGPHKRPYLRSEHTNFEKTEKARYLELIINDVKRKRQPEFFIKQW